MSSIIAIDFGNKNCIVAGRKESSINILNNQEFQRLTPTMISFSQHRRYFGSSAQQKQMENVKSTITQLKQLVGLPYQSEKRQAIEKLESCTLVPGPTTNTFFKIDFLEKERVFSVEQCVAYLLYNCFEIAKLNNVIADKCVIVVPPWWSEVERRIIIDSAKVTGIKIAKLLNSTTAEAISYFVDHKKIVDEQESKHAVFIDFGDCCFNSAIVQFHKESIEVKGYSYNNDISGSSLTQILANYLQKIIREKYKIDPSTNRRSMIRFIEATEKLKKGLSINQVMQFEVEINGIYINFPVKRTDFEQQIKGLIDSMSKTIEESIQMSGVTTIDEIFTIELHGGSSRIPAVKEKIAELFGTDPKQSLNSDECFAMGAAYQAAFLSMHYSSKVSIKDIFCYQICIECDDFPEENHRKEIFKQFQVIPCTKILTHRIKQRKTVIYVKCEDTTIIGALQINLIKQEEATVNITFQLNQSGIVEVRKVVLQPPKKSLWNFGQSDFDENDIDFQYKSILELPDAVIKDMINQEKEMESIDKTEEERDEVRNSLESYIFKLKNALNSSDDSKYFEPEMIRSHLKLVEEVEEWFYEHGEERHSIQKFNDILKELKSIGDPAFKNQKDRENLLLFLNKLIDRAGKCKSYLSNLDSDTADQFEIELDLFVESVKNYIDEINKVPLHTNIVSEDEKKSLKVRKKDLLNDQIYQIEKKLKNIFNEDAQN